MRRKGNAFLRGVIPALDWMCNGLAPTHQNTGPENSAALTL